MQYCRTLQVILDSFKFARLLLRLALSSIAIIIIITFPCYHVYAVSFEVTGYNVCCVANINTVLFYTNNLVHMLGTTTTFQEEI